MRATCVYNRQNIKKYIYKNIIREALTIEVHASKIGSDEIMSWKQGPL